MKRIEKYYDKDGNSLVISLDLFELELKQAIKEKAGEGFFNG